MFYLHLPEQYTKEILLSIIILMYKDCKKNKCTVIGRGHNTNRGYRGYMMAKNLCN